MPLKNKSKRIVPWDYKIGDDNYQIEPWILKKGKEYVILKKTILIKVGSIFKRMMRNVYL